MRKGIKLERDRLTIFLDEYLRVNEIEDASQNGLQVEGPKEVTRIAFAVDGCLATFEQAVAQVPNCLSFTMGFSGASRFGWLAPSFRGHGCL